MNLIPKFKAKKSLKRRRERLGVDQTTMAALITDLTGRKMSYSRYQKIEQGIYEVELNTAIAICKMFASDNDKKEDAQILDIWTHVKDVEKV